MDVRARARGEGITPQEGAGAGDGQALQGEDEDLRILGREVLDVEVVPAASIGSPQ